MRSVLLHSSSLFAAHMIFFWGAVLACDRRDGVPLYRTAGALARVLRNQFCVILPCLVMQEVAWKHGALPTEHGALEDSARLALALLVGELLVYALHRAAHAVPAVYKHVHSMHHQRAYSAASALSSDWREVLLLNELAIYAPFVMLGLPPPLVRASELLGTLMAVATHAQGPLARSLHLNHHLLFNCNYSTWGLADWALGTYVAFDESAQREKKKKVIDVAALRASMRAGKAYHMHAD